jgi:outer membrane protein
MLRAIVFSLFTVTAFGQTAPPPQTLTLEQAVAIALGNHPKIAAAQNQELASGQRVIEARSAYYPIVTADVTASQANPLSRIGAGFLATSSLFNREGDGFTASQLITDSGRTKNLVATSTLQAQAATQTTAATRYDIVLGVNRAYYEVLQAQALVKVALETAKTRQTLVDQITALTNAQLKSLVDLSFVKVNLSEAQLLVIRAQDNLKQAFADLSRALGQDTSPAQYTLAENPSKPELPPDIAPLVAEAIQNRPELADLRLRYEASQKFETAEHDLKKPNLTLVAVAGALPYIDQNPRIAPEGYEGVALNLEIPVFNGHLFSAREQAAHFESLAMSQRLRDLRQQVEHDVNAAWLTAQNAAQRIPVTAELVTQAQLSLTLAQGRYDLGLASIVEITQAQLNLTQAQIENVTAGYDYQSAWASLQYTIGALR